MELMGKESRRSVIQKAAILGLMATAGETGCAHLSPRYEVLKTANPRRAAVIWFSQTGHTRTIGRLAAHVLRAEGLDVVDGDYRSFNESSLQSFDFIIAGSPVFYFCVPSNFRDWISHIPRIDGIPTAAFVTFGGAGHNQHNAAFELLENFTERGAVPLCIDMFAHMSAFAPTWSTGREARILRYRDLPNEATFEAARIFARRALSIVRRKENVRIERRIAFWQLLKHMNMPWWTKLFASKHAINRDTCIQCGTCQEVCPVGAVSYREYRVDRNKCIFCVGCVNNCPTGAMEMTYSGSEVYGYREFRRRHGITLRIPPELVGQPK
jgi:ferredoxin/flavodoxin